eukprot:TRINITY_DN1799_c0_g1_i1.p2 TRINITY_DN1799_c0_g1~~TRINITY_DN1799_c0_g1_i1.p2  ORF type:complete len:270 (+),score=56.59 TRINITY_DN1799_c0_g1_i1:66-812(+)
MPPKPKHKQSTTSAPAPLPLSSHPRHPDLSPFVEQWLARFGLAADAITAVALGGDRAAVRGALAFERASEGVLLKADITRAFPRVKITWAVETESFAAFQARGAGTEPSNSTASEAGVADMNEVELVEFHDSEAVLDRKVEHLADLLAASKHAVFYTGAGISTSANIPDFRGPNGVWTRRDRKLPPPKSVEIAQAQPTLAHFAMKQMLDRGTIKYLVSQNVDGLHRRSGVPRTSISELHGNAFRERDA